MWRARPRACPRLRFAGHAPTAGDIYPDFLLRTSIVLSVKQKVGERTADGLRWRDGAYTIRGVMQVLAVDKSTVHHWIEQGRLHGEHDGPYMPWRFTLTQQQIRRLRRSVRRTGRSPATPADR